MNIKKFLKSKGIKYQVFEINEYSSKKDTSKIEFLKYLLHNNKDKM